MTAQKSAAKYIVPLPVGGAFGWATGAISGGTIPAAWTWSAMAAWAWVPLNWAPVVMAVGAGTSTFFGLRRWLEGDPSERHHRITHDLLTGDIVERAEAAIEAGTMNPEQCLRLADKLKLSAMDTGGATPEQAARFAETTIDLAQSESAADRRIAEEAIEGRPEKAADKLIAKARAGNRRNAERFRQAARIYAPFARSKAMDAYKEAVGLDPTDIWSWIELGRLRLQYSTLADARNCFAVALQYVTDERDRAALHVDFGDILTIEGELPEARAEYEAGLAIREKLATLEPANTQWQRDLSISYETLGDVEVAAGNLGAARSRYEAGLAIAEMLAALEPANSEWQRDLSVSFNKLGDVEVAAGSLGAARSRYEAAFAIAEGLAALEPANSEWQRDLYVSLDRLARVSEVDAEPAVAIAHYRRAEAIMDTVADHSPDHPGFANDLANIRAELARLGD